MAEFRRNPSKVWWASESLEWREVSESPGSQDSGFSDTETSPAIQLHNQEHRIPESIYKEPSSAEKPQNLSINFKEKATPEKNTLQQSGESPRKSRFAKNSPKVSRNLFSSVRQKESVKDVLDQYSKDALQDTTHSSISSEVTTSGSYSCAEDDRVLRFSQSLPVFTNSRNFTFLNKSAPAVIQDTKDEEETSFTGNHSLSSDCESELECLFNSPLASPKHTSTPKVSSMRRMRFPREKLPLNIYLKYQQQRVPPLIIEDINNDAVKKWTAEIKQHYELECMTTLQSKSIANELNQKVAHKATLVISNIQNILAHSQCIEREYKNLNSEKNHVGPLAQSLAGNIVDFLRNYSRNTNPNISKCYDEIRKASTEEALKLVVQMFNLWQLIYQDVLISEVKKLIDKLENPRSELDLRATITGITSISLRNPDLVDKFTRHDIIPILLILCEKCEGSSMRSLLLRALSTVCCSTFSVRQFEKFSGIQIVTDTLDEDSRPEPERSEAVALLAQVTAPWIEDNHCIRGLPEYSRKLVKSLTKFATTTHCCQNLLLCAAALANLSTMDTKCIKYMLHLNTIYQLLEAVNHRGPCASVYLLEQVATLLANMAAFEVARKQLTDIRAVAALLCFLKTTHVGGDVEKRLQQKAMIALSRLCSEREAAKQVVELGGVEKLVKMCREKDERFDSDAVLVATLATLRKITDMCGNDVISSEDAQELVEPKLLDSFLAYSTQSESYV